MRIFLHFQRAEIFKEFSRAEQKQYFDTVEKKVAHHIDTFYYNIFLMNDTRGNEHPGLKQLIFQLKELKQEALICPAVIPVFYRLDVMTTGFSLFQYHLQLKENYDIFIADDLRTDETPRICVQLRSRYIVKEGISKAIVESYNAVVKILEDYNLEVFRCGENRIDYAFHTNLIQNSAKFFNDNYLRQHLKTKLVDYNKYGKLHGMTVDTINFGKRSSNDYFFRAYNKTKEVIEKNYKSFFFDIWRDKGLISEFDYFVYQKAYELKSYTTGILVGRIEWYLKYGKNEELKERLRSMLEHYYRDSDNAPKIEKELRGILPEVTIVTNVEFQTKRKFYKSLDNWVREHPFSYEGIPELERLYKLIYLRKSILNYLTNKAVCFVDKKGTKEEKLASWWSRICSCRIEYNRAMDDELYRSGERKTDLVRSRNQLLSSIAQFAIIKNYSLAETTFESDVSDALAYLNDNDFYGFSAGPEGQLPQISNYQYEHIQAPRKRRQYNGLIKYDEAPGFIGPTKPKLTPSEKNKLKNKQKSKPKSKSKRGNKK